MPDPSEFQIKEEDMKNFDNCGDFGNGEGGIIIFTPSRSYDFELQTTPRVVG
jgi:hypothetical protein